MLNIKIDSRKVTKGDIFVAIKGHTVDGHNYINQAIANGAIKIVANYGDYSVPTEIVEDTEKYVTDYVEKNYSQELNNMKIIGITGTNGKTTTAYLLYQLLNKLGLKTAYIGTIGFYLDKFIEEIPNTTPNIVDLYELLLRAKESGYKNIVMEVSSHALDMRRVAGIKFSQAAFTNLTQDHLDYHKTMANYLDAKKLILKQLNGPMISNIDDPYGKEFKTDNFITLGFNPADYQIISYENTKTGTSINFKYQKVDYQLNTKLRGKYNVYNFITAVAIANQCGFSIEDIIKLSETINPPKGRCQIIPVKNGEAIIDYAHTPDAVLKIVTTFNEHKKGRVITLVGCGGDRDPKKRPIMGKIASENSDYVIFTSDNPRTENPQKIMDDIIAGVNKDNYEIELDRRKAIHKALDMIKENDIVLILGKGHEDYQILGHQKVHLDDAEEVEKYNQSKSNH